MCGHFLGEETHIVVNFDLEMCSVTKKNLIDVFPMSRKICTQNIYYSFIFDIASFHIVKKYASLNLELVLCEERKKKPHTNFFFLGLYSKMRSWD